ncbi:hypothetical protein MASR2M79_12740 [Aminivibrio sp.]
MSLLEQGLIQIYMGDGKGKTSSALGLAVRMAGCGGKTAIIQFMKGWEYSEVKGLSYLPGVHLVQTGRPDYVYPDAVAPEDYTEAERGLRAARKFLSSGEYDLVILDEISVALLRACQDRRGSRAYTGEAPSCGTRSDRQKSSSGAGRAG